MSWSVLKQCLEIARDPDIITIDITGGAPELNPNLSAFIEQAAQLDKRLIVRSNLVILDNAPYRQFIDLYARFRVEIVGSLPDVHAAKTDRQRGNGIFDREIAVLRELNSRGYGMENSPLKLDLVHTPVGAFLPGSQKTIEQDYRQKLLSEYGIRFSSLFCLTNNPIGRYREFLIQTDNYDDYMNALASAYNPCAAAHAMCRSLISVGWDGRLYDCDFNQALGHSVNNGVLDHIDHFDKEKLKQRILSVGNHCYACTAGAGSSCQGVVDK
jgi:radical SAM/Cys-rich protein